MLRIGVCDDESVFRQQIVDCLNQCVEEKIRPETEIQTFGNGKDLIKAAGKKRFDIVFLDVEMEEMDGLQAAAVLRRQDQKTIIVYISSYPEYALDAFKVKAFRFLKKPVESEGFKKLWRVVLEEYQELYHQFAFMVSGIPNSCEIQEIFYIEADGNYIRIHTEETVVFNVMMRMKEAEEKLKAVGFVRVHHRFLVNLRKIKTFERYTLTLKNGENLNISRRKWDEFMEAKMALLRSEAL